MRFTGAVNIQMYHWASPVFNAGMMDPYGTAIRRNNDGTWTETTTDYPLMGLIISGVNFPDRVTGSA
jgi:hypothetical protein